MVVNFVSVSGVANQFELEQIARFHATKRFDFPVAIGYQLSHKTVNGEQPNPRQPSFSELPRLTRLTRASRLLPSLHYYTKDNATIIPDLEMVVERGCVTEPTLLQFNTLPPSSDILERVKDMGFNVIFKVAVANKETGGYAVWKGDHVQDACKGNVDILVDQIEHVANFIDYAMFDPSHGTNIGLELNKESLAVQFGQKVRERNRLHHVGLVYAGGIKPENVSSVVKNLQYYFPSGFSIDTESGVRDVLRNNETIISDKLNLEKVEAYLLNCRRALTCAT